MPRKPKKIACLACETKWKEAATIGEIELRKQSKLRKLSKRSFIDSKLRSKS